MLWVEVGAVLSGYHYALDGRDWDELRGYLSPDIVMELPNGTVFEGRESVITFLSRPRTPSSPLSHHLSNVIVDSEAGDTVRTRSKYLAVCADGTVLSGIYSDLLARQDEAWVIVERRVRRIAGSPPPGGGDQP